MASHSIQRIRCGSFHHADVSSTTHGFLSCISLIFASCCSVGFSVTLPGSEDAVQCSAATGAAISSSPFLLPITNGKCVDGSGLTFNFTQVEDLAIKLDVENAQGVQATHTSEPDSVSFIQTGSTPLDTMTAYTGSADFDLSVVA